MRRPAPAPRARTRPSASSRPSAKAGKPSAARRSILEQFALREAPGHLLRRCHQRSYEIFTEMVGTDGPTRQQVALLVTVFQHPDSTQTELCRRTGIDKNTLAEMVRRLASQGWIEQERAPHDSRALLVRIRPAGEAVLAEVLPIVERVQRAILEPLPASLRPVFLRCLRKVSGIDEALAEPAGRKPAKRGAARSPSG